MTMITLPPCKKNTIKRFWNRVNKNGPQIAYVDDKCWLWTGTYDPGGYGNVNIKSKNYPAHRISWLLQYGDFPDITGKCRKYVLHKCDVRACVNPDHLFLGTHADNMRDMAEKGRGTTKLTRKQVLEIRRVSYVHSVYGLAKQFHVSVTTIQRVLRRKTWKHV